MSHSPGYHRWLARRAGRWWAETEGKHTICLGSGRDIPALKNATDIPVHKELHLLGLLLLGPKTGYQLHRITQAHGELYTDLKKGNVYYLLDRLAKSGALEVAAEAGAPGPRRERLVYAITDYGRQRFHELLREVLRTYELPHTGVEVGMVFLPYLDVTEVTQLLTERRSAVLDRRAAVVGEMHSPDHGHVSLAQDHLLSLIEAELSWIERTIRRLQRKDEEDES
jgi:DNA-binding PadR family transcriptional regulator